MAKISTTRTGKAVARGKAMFAESTSTQSIDAPLDDDTRRAMIAEAAYYRAERRGFAPGFELEDWLTSESELAARIQSQSLERSPAGSGEMH